MRRVLLALLVSAGAILAGTAPAEAGGPTSVLLASPSHQSAAGLYYTDPRYAELEELLHGPDAAEGTSDPQPGSADQVNVTWLVHDVSIWRTDTLLLDGSGDVWLLTSDEWGGPNASAAEGDWFRLRQAGRLRELVGSLGLLGGTAAEGESAGDSAAAAETDDAEAAVVVAPAPPEVREETEWFSLAGWRWAVPGLLLGLLVAGLAVRGRSVRDGRPAPTPRQELVDRAPASAG